MDHTLPQPGIDEIPILTVNARLERWRLLAHDERQRQSGLKAWPTPPIFSLDSWLKAAWVSTWPEKYFLNELQSQALWKSLVENDRDTAHHPLLDRAGLAERASQAYRLIKEYRLPVTAGEFGWTEETRAFRTWMRRYEKKLETLGALDPSEAIDRVSDAMRAGTLPVPGALVLAGFEELTPQLADWIGLLETRGARITFDPEIPAPAPHPTSVSVRRYDHRHEEALQCARWVRSIYRPGSTLGIVVPELEDYRTLLDHELTAELAPGKIYPWVEEGKPFNISLGTPLAHEPMVRLALTFLGHSSTVIPLSTFAEILTSPFFTCGRDVLEEARALDRELRDKRASRIDLDHPPAVMQTGQAPEIITLASTWSAHLQNGRSLRPRQWAEVFNETLTRAGWPAAGEPRSARARQALAAWYKNLEILASLDRVLGRISRREAAATLERIALAPEFQVKTPEQPIQVVGLLESAGMRFDHLWVMGCHADVFPGSPSPNPFIPIALRKQYRLPRASASRELEFAENSLRRLLATAPDVVLSYPEWEGNTQLQMSPLLDLWRKEDSNIKIHQSHREKDRCGKPGLELLRESLLLPVAGSEAARFAATLPGGTSVLKDIAACPFRAFAVHRLGVKVVELPEIDFDHPERGSLVHRALEFFWRGVKSKTRLMELESRHRLEEALAQAVTDALGDLARQGRFFDIERERVTRLLLDWMRDIEMKRADFEVTGEEKDVTLDIGGLKLKMRVDRIDRAAGGKVLVIDYKTGEAKPSGWFGERIQEPQLPLYAVKLAPDAVVFAQVLKGKMRLHAAGDPRPPADPGYVNIEKISGCAGWPELLKQWRQNLEAAAGRFLAGDTQVDPHHENICGYCGMESLCRIEALTEDEHGEEDDA